MTAPPSPRLGLPMLWSGRSCSVSMCIFSRPQRPANWAVPQTVPKCQIIQLQFGEGRLQHTALGEQYASVSHWNVG